MHACRYVGEKKCGPASTFCSPYTNWAFFSVANLSVTEPTTLVATSGDWPSPPWFSYTDGDDGTATSTSIMSIVLDHVSSLASANTVTAVPDKWSASRCPMLRADWW